MTALRTADEIRDVNTRYHDVAAESYDSKWGIDFGELGQSQVLRKLRKLVGSELDGGYRRSLDWALAHSRITLLILLITIGFNIYLYIIVPKGFFPQQDVGRLTGMIQADQSISFQAMRGKLADFVDVVSKDPAVDNVVGFTGGGQLNSARMFIALKPIARPPACPMAGSEVSSTPR